MMTPTMTIVYTHHACIRMQQRGFRDGDIELVLEYGTQIDDETWFMRDRDASRESRLCKRKIRTLEHPKGKLVRNRDASRETRRLKRKIRAFERLKNTKVVMCGDKIVTVYRSGAGDRKRTLRRGREKAALA